LCDDRPLVRARCHEAFAQAPGIQVVGEADGGHAGIKMALQLKPDVVVMDVDMPDLDGVEATRFILARAPDIKVLAYSAGNNSDVVREMFSAGASGYLVKGGDAAELIEAVYSLVSGRPYLSGRVVLGPQETPENAGAGFFNNPGRTQIHTPANPVHCLLVDDSFVVRDRLVELLSSLDGFVVTGQAGDLAAGTQLMKEKKPDVLILDIDLIGQSGIALLEVARTYNPAVVVVMLTNHDHPVLRRRCADLGADFFFHKATEFEKVFEVCRDLVVRRNFAAGPGPRPASGNPKQGRKQGKDGS
jgi:DNA-binding NarL/FixJ family response regulator